MKSNFLGIVLILVLATSVMGFITQIGAILEKGSRKLSGSEISASGYDSPDKGKELKEGSFDEHEVKLPIHISRAYAQAGKTSGKGEGAEAQKSEGQGVSSEVKSPQTVSQKDCAGFLENKTRELNEREKLLAEREAALKALQKDIEDKLARLEEIQKNIEAFKKEQERLKNEKIDSLVKIYGSMKPKEASKLLEKLDDDLVVTIISRMTTDQAARIIANMDVKKAAEISQKLSRVRNSTTP